MVFPDSRAHFAAQSTQPCNTLCTVEHGGSLPVINIQTLYEATYGSCRIVPFQPCHPTHLRVSISHIFKPFRILPKPLFSSHSYVKILLLLPSVYEFIFRTSFQYTPTDSLNIASILIDSSLPSSATFRLLDSPSPRSSALRDSLRSRFVECSKKKILQSVKSHDLIIILYPETTILDLIKASLPFLVYVPKSTAFTPSSPQL